MDLGPHALDWLCFLFGEKISLNQYSDDAKSGIETDCHLQLAFMYKRRKLKGDVLLSRIRALGGDLIVECEHATLKLSVGERFKVDVQPKKTDDQKASNDSFESVSYQASQPNIYNEDWFETFAKEHDDFANAIMSKVEPELSAESVLPAAKIIDECYASKKQLDFDWASTSHMPWPAISGLKRIFISGASGFVGGRIVEVLTEASDVSIVAGVNNPNNATRLSRYELEIAKCDLNDFESLNRAIKGCDAVIHCAVGTAYGDDALIYKTTVEGTKNLLNASLNNGVKKFIHMSSLAAIDMENAKGVLDETSCTESTSQDIYAKSKLAAEKAVLEHAQTTNLDVTILRPTTIYGPYSPLFKIGAGKQSVTNGIQLSASHARSPSNSIYIDNVVLAVMHILNALPKEAPLHKSPSVAVYFLNDDDGFNYQDFYAYFTKSFNCPLKITQNPTLQKSISNKEKSHISAIFSETKSIIASKEMRKLLLKTYNSKTIGLPARWLLNKFPKLEDKFRDSRGPVFLQKSKPKQTPTQIESSTEASVSINKFKNDFPTYSALSRNESLDLTEKWIRFSQIAKTE
jgi:nucleoside-diphosphate-sugar epimerase